MIQVGDIVRLRDSIFHTEFLKMDQYALWSNKYLYEDEFKYTCLRFPNLGKTGDMAKTIFGSSHTKVIHIEYIECNIPFIVTTDFFEIVIEAALQNREVEILSSDVQSFKLLQAEKELIGNLEFFELKYLEGLFDVNERDNNKLDMYKLGFHLMVKEGKWKNTH